MAKAKALRREIVLPVDVVVAQQLAAHVPTRVVAVDDVGPADMILDIGPRSIEQSSPYWADQNAGLERAIRRVREQPFDNGTIEVAEAAAELTAAGRLASIAGGGDTMAALNSRRSYRPFYPRLDGGRRVPRVA